MCLEEPGHMQTPPVSSSAGEIAPIRSSVVSTAKIV